MSLKANASGAVAMLRRKAGQLRAIAAGAAAQAAAPRVGEAMLKAGREACEANLSTSVRTVASFRVNVAGTTITLVTPFYMRLHKWWAFTNGVPAEVRDEAARLYREEAVRILRG